MANQSTNIDITTQTNPNTDSPLYIGDTSIDNVPNIFQQHNKDIAEEYSEQALKDTFIRQAYGDNTNNYTSNNLQGKPIDYEQPIAPQIEHYDGNNTAPTGGNWKDTGNSSIIDGDTIVTSDGSFYRMKGLSAVESVPHTVTIDKINELPLDQRADAYAKLKDEEKIKQGLSDKTNTALKYMIDNYKVIAVNEEKTAGTTGDVATDIHNRKLANDVLLQDSKGNVTSMSNLMLQFGIAVDANGRGGQSLTPEEKARDIAEQEYTRYHNNLDDINKKIDIEANLHNSFMDNLTLKLRGDLQEGKISEDEAVSIYEGYKQKTSFENKQRKLNDTVFEDTVMKYENNPDELAYAILQMNANGYIKKGDKLNESQTLSFINHYLDKSTGGIKDKYINRDNPEKQRAMLNTIIARFGSKTKIGKTKSGEPKKNKEFFEFNDMNSRKAIVIDPKYLTPEQLDIVDNQGSLFNIANGFSTIRNRTDVLTDIAKVAVDARMSPSSVIDAISVFNDASKFQDPNNKSAYSLKALNEARVASGLKPFDTGLNLGIDVKGRFWEDLTSFDSTMVENLISDTLANDKLNNTSRNKIINMAKGLSVARALNNDEFKNSATIMDRLVSRTLTKVSGSFDKSWEILKATFSAVDTEEADKAYKEEANRLFPYDVVKRRDYITRRKQINGNVPVAKDDTGILRPVEDIIKEAESKWDNIEKSTGYNRAEEKHFMNENEAIIYPSGFSDTLITSGLSILSLVTPSSSLSKYVNERAREEALRGGSIRSLGANLISGVGSFKIASTLSKAVAGSRIVSSMAKSGDLLTRANTGYGLGTATLTTILDTGINTTTGAFSPNNRGDNIWLDDKGNFDFNLFRRAEKVNAGSFMTGLAMNAVITGVAHTAGKAFGKDIEDVNTGKYVNGLNEVYTKVIAPTLSKNEEFTTELYNNIKSISDELGFKNSEESTLSYDDMKYIPDDKVNIIYMDAMKKTLLKFSRDKGIDGISDKALSNMIVHLNQMSNISKLQFHNKFGESWKENINRPVSKHIEMLRDKEEKLSEIKGFLNQKVTWLVPKGKPVDPEVRIPEIDEEIEQLHSEAGNGNTDIADRLDNLRKERSVLTQIFENDNKTDNEVKLDKAKDNLAVAEAKVTELSNELDNTPKRTGVPVEIDGKTTYTPRDNPKYKEVETALAVAKKEQTKLRSTRARLENIVSKEEKARKQDIEKELKPLKNELKTETDKLNKLSDTNEDITQQQHKVWSLEEAVRSKELLRDNRGKSVNIAQIDALNEMANDNITPITPRAQWAKDRLKDIRKANKLKEKLRVYESIAEGNEEVKIAEEDVKQYIEKSNKDIPEEKDVTASEVNKSVKETIETVGKKTFEDIVVKLEDNAVDNAVENNRVKKTTDDVEREIKQSLDSDNTIAQVDDDIVHKTEKVSDTINEPTYIHMVIDTFKRLILNRAVMLDNDELQGYKKIFKREENIGNGRIFLTDDSIKSEEDAKRLLAKTYTETDGKFFSKVGKALSSNNNRELEIGSRNSRLKIHKHKVNGTDKYGIVLFRNQTVNGRTIGDTVVSGLIGVALRQSDMAYIFLQSDSRFVDYAIRNGYINNTGALNKPKFAKGVSNTYRKGDFTLTSVNDSTKTMNIFNIAKEAIKEDMNIDDAKASRIVNNIFADMLGIERKLGEDEVYSQAFTGDIGTSMAEKMKRGINDIKIEKDVIDEVNRENTLNFKTDMKQILKAVIEHYNNKGDIKYKESNSGEYISKYTKGKSDEYEVLDRPLSPIDFIMFKENADLKEAVNILYNDIMHIGKEITVPDTVVEKAVKANHSSGIVFKNFVPKGTSVQEAVNYYLRGRNLPKITNGFSLGHFVKDLIKYTDGFQIAKWNKFDTERIGLQYTDKYGVIMERQVNQGGKIQSSRWRAGKQPKRVFSTQNYPKGQTPDYVIVAESINDALGYMLHLSEDEKVSLQGKNIKIVDMAGLPSNPKLVSDEIGNTDANVHFAKDNFNDIANSTNNDYIKNIDSELRSKYGEKYSSKSPSEAGNDIKGKDWNEYASNARIEEIASTKTFFEKLKYKLSNNDKEDERKAGSVVAELLNKIEGLDKAFNRDKIDKETHYDIVRDRINIGKDATFRKVLHEIIHSIQHYKSEDKDMIVSGREFHYILDATDDFNKLTEFPNVSKFLKSQIAKYEKLITANDKKKYDLSSPLHPSKVAKNKAVRELYAEMFNDISLMEEMGRMKIDDNGIISTIKDGNVAEFRNDSVVSKLINFVKDTLTKLSGKEPITIFESSVAHQVAEEMDSVITNYKAKDRPVIKDRITERNLLYSASRDLKEEINLYGKVTGFIDDNIIRRIPLNGYMALDYKFRTEFGTKIEKALPYISKIGEAIAIADQRFLAGIGSKLSVATWDILNSGSVSNKILEKYYTDISLLPNNVNSVVKAFRNKASVYIDGMKEDTKDAIPMLIQLGIGYINSPKIRLAVKALGTNDIDAIKKQYKVNKGQMDKLSNLIARHFNESAKEDFNDKLEKLVRYVSIHENIDGTPHNAYHLANEYLGEIYDAKDIKTISTGIAEYVVFKSMSNQKIFDKVAGKIHPDDITALSEMFPIFKRANEDGYKIGRMGDIIDPILLEKNIIAISQKELDALPERDRKILLRNREYQVKSADGYRYFYSQDTKPKQQTGKFLPDTDYQNIDAEIYNVTKKMIDDANNLYGNKDANSMNSYIRDTFYEGREDIVMNIFPVVNDNGIVTGFKKVIPRNKSYDGFKIDGLSAMEAIIADKNTKIMRDTLQSKMFEESNIQSGKFLTEEAERNFFQGMKESLDIKNGEIDLPYIFINEDTFAYMGNEALKFFKTKSFTDKYVKITNEERLALPLELRGETYIRKEFADNALTYKLDLGALDSELTRAIATKLSNAIQLFKIAVTLGNVKTIMNGIIANAIQLPIRMDGKIPVKEIIETTNEALDFQEKLIKLQEYALTNEEDKYNALKEEIEASRAYKYYRLGFSSTMVDGVETDIRRSQIPLYKEIGVWFDDVTRGREKSIGVKYTKKVTSELFLSGNSKVRKLSANMLRMGDSIAKSILFEYLYKKYRAEGLSDADAEFKSAKEATEAFVDPRQNFSKGIAYADTYGVPFVGWYSQYAKSMTRLLKEKPTSTLLVSGLLYSFISDNDPSFRNESINPLGTLLSPPDVIDEGAIPNLFSDTMSIINTID